MIFFLKYPEKGRVKTRLSRVLGEEFVYELYRCFIDDILSEAKKCPHDIIISCFACSSSEISHFLGEEFIYEDQRGNDLGERMYNALSDAFSRGYDQVVLFGSDIPDISERILDKAFDSLDHHDLVIGPSADGGYYLIGCNRDSFRKELFYDVTWSTSLVFFETLNKIEKLSLSCFILDELFDIDEVNDLKAFYRQHLDSERDSRTMRFLKTAQGGIP